jgi:hypothetical protein
MVEADEQSFLRVYEDNVKSDHEDDDEEEDGDDPLGLGEPETMDREDSPEPAPQLSYMERHKLLKARGAKNREVSRLPLN